VRVALICPASRGSRAGNRITALRWQGIFRELGHECFVAEALGRKSDVVVALHARKSAAAVHDAQVPVALALTGTDLYRDIHRNADAQRSLRLADLLVVLHDLAALELPRNLRHKVRVVPQSSPPIAPRRKTASSFDVAVVGHLRPEKDPLRTALAARLLPDTSRIRILHAGRALTPELRRAALAEQRINPRYRWLGELSPQKARALIAKSRLLCLTSEIEGGANVLSEALAAGTPVIASRIPAAQALLGKRYPGLFPFASTRTLAHLLARCERDASFLRKLALACRARRPLVSRGREKRAWRQILRELRHGI
jgi:putative glycosyltransferase (TIGR04348 family)